MTAPVIIGVDPGMNETGIVMRQGEDCWGNYVATRKDERWPSYFTTIVNCINDFWYDQHERYRVMSYIAVEDVTKPNPHLGMMNPGSLIGTAKVFGAVLASFPGAIVVPPGGNGSGPLSAYPQALRPTRGKGAGKDKLRHCRSAWDVAGAAGTLLKMLPNEPAPSEREAV